MRINKYSYTYATYPEVKVDQLIPLRVLLIPDHLCLPLVPSKGHSAERVHQILLNSANTEELFHSLKIARVHLRKVLPSEDTNAHCCWPQVYIWGVEKIAACMHLIVCVHVQL